MKANEAVNAVRAAVEHYSDSAGQDALAMRLEHFGWTAESGHRVLVQSADNYRVAHHREFVDAILEMSEQPGIHLQYIEPRQLESASKDRQMRAVFSLQPTRESEVMSMLEQMHGSLGQMRGRLQQIDQRIGLQAQQVGNGT